MRKLERLITIHPWELVPGATQREVLNHLDGDQIIEWVDSEKRMKRARAEAEARELKVIEDYQPARQEIVISAMEVQAALMAKR